MAIRTIDPRHHVVQVQRGPLRRTKRVTGTIAEAKKIEEQLTAELAHELKLDEAAATLGVERGTPAARPAPTFKAFFEERWGEHARVVQNERTRRAQKAPFRYLIFYLGERPLTDLLRPSAVNRSKSQW